MGTTVQQETDGLTAGRCYCGHAARTHVDGHAICLAKRCGCLIYREQPESTDTTCVICKYTYSDLSNELNVQGICTDCRKAGYFEAPEEEAIPLTCHSCARPTTEDESVVVRPGQRYCLACIKAGKVTNPEPEQDESDEGGMWPADWTETR